MTLAAQPLLSKDDLLADQREHPPFGTNLSCPESHLVRLHQTSGSTGQPLLWPDSARNWEGFLESWELVLRAAGVTASDRVYVAFSFGPFIGFWGAFEAAQKLGALTLSGGAQSSEQRLDQIVAFGATVVVCTPTYALRLAEVAESRGVDLARSAVRVTLHAGEPGASVPAVARQLEQAWGARCHDHAGATEVGAWGYPAPDGLFVDESRFVVELRDPEDGSIVPGHEIGPTIREGELVLTNLARPDRPVVRYRTGDLVRACRPGLRAESDLAVGARPDARLWLPGGVLGRLDDMFVVRGVNVYPSAVDGIVRQVPAVVEYRAEVLRDRQMSELRLRIELQPDLDDAGRRSALEQLERRFREALHLRVPIELVDAGTLPRFELKAKRFDIRERGDR